MNQYEFEKTDSGEVLIREINKKKVVESYQKLFEEIQ